MNNQERKLLNKRDAVMIAVLFLLAAGGMIPRLIPNSGSGTAVITCGGSEIAQISLMDDGIYTFPETGDMVFTVKDGEIAVTESGCGDLTCVRTGGIASPGEAIVCVPNRTAVFVEGISGDELDVVLQ